MITNERKKLVSDLKLNKTLKDLETVVNELFTEVYEPRVSFERNDILSRSLDTSLLDYLNHHLCGQPNISFADMKPHHSQEVNIETESDKDVAWISGSVFLPSGELALCDRNNDSLKVLRHDFTPVGSLWLSGKPGDCCSFDANNVFLTLPEKNTVQRWQILPSLYVICDIKST